MFFKHKLLKHTFKNVFLSQYEPTESSKLHLLLETKFNITALFVHLVLMSIKQQMWYNKKILTIQKVRFQDPKTITPLSCSLHPSLTLLPLPHLPLSPSSPSSPTSLFLHSLWEPDLVFQSRSTKYYESLLMEMSTMIIPFFFLQLP